MSPLEQIQSDIAARLNSLAYFVDVPAFIVREQKVDSMIEQALTAVSQKNGKSGVALSVLMPTIDCEKPDAPGPYLEGEVEILAQEIPLINFGATGTQKSAEDVALYALKSLHHFTLVGVCGILTAAKQTLTPDRRFLPKVTERLRIAFKLPIASLDKVPMPSIVGVAGTMTLSCAMGGVTIFFTADGSYPHPDNDNGTEYTGPAPYADGTRIRAAAYLADFVGSNVNQAILSA